MDLRIKRTRSSIIDAFIQLRSSKPLEKITVKELADLAFINKATFYAHYKDIYDLAEQLENEAVDKMIADIAHPEYIVTDPKDGAWEMVNSILMQGQLFDILFSGSRQTRLRDLLDTKIKARVYELLPQAAGSLEMDLSLSVMIQGNFYAVLNHKDSDFKQVMDILGDISACIFENCKFNFPKTPPKS